MKLHKLWEKIKTEWPLEVSASIFLAVAFLLLTTKLRTLLGGFSEAELHTESVTNTFPSVIDNLLYWPYYASVYLMRFVISDAVTAARIVSAMLGFISVLCIFLIIKRWFNSRLAIVGSTVFLTGSWFLALARSGTPQISGIAALLLLYVTALWLINSPKKLLPSIAFFITTIFAWFVPFLPWLLGAGVVLVLVRQKELIKIVPKWVWGMLVLSSMLIMGVLAYGIFKNYDQAADILGIPRSMPTPINITKSFQKSLAALFWFAPTRPGNWLGNLPLLDIFGVVMVTLGVYHHEKHFGSRRSVILFGSVAIISILLVLNGGIDSHGFTLLLPIMAILIISGIQEFLGLWAKVFPRNMLAKFLAAGAVSLLVTMSAFYQLSRYYVAWPGAPETREVYSANFK